MKSELLEILRLNVKVIKMLSANVTLPDYEKYRIEEMLAEQSELIKQIKTTART